MAGLNRSQLRGVVSPFSRSSFSPEDSPEVGRSRNNLLTSSCKREILRLLVNRLIVNLFADVSLLYPDEIRGVSSLVLQALASRI